MPTNSTVPPLAGFVSKWYLALGGLEAGQGWLVPLLLASTVLNLAYFLPILYGAEFSVEPDRKFPLSNIYPQMLIHVRRPARTRRRG